MMSAAEKRKKPPEAAQEQEIPWPEFCAPCRLMNPLCNGVPPVSRRGGLPLGPKPKDQS